MLPIICIEEDCNPYVPGFTKIKFRDPQESDCCVSLMGKELTPKDVLTFLAKHNIITITTNPKEI